MPFAVAVLDLDANVAVSVVANDDRAVGGVAGKSQNVILEGYATRTAAVFEDFQLRPNSS